MPTVALILLVLLPPSGPGETPLVGPTDSNDRAKRQAERVMNSGLPFAEEMLAEQREFVPFGAVMRPDGLIQVVGTPNPEESRPIDEIFRELARGLAEGVNRGEYRTVATFALVELRNPADGEIITAVHVALEHRDGYCVDVYYPTLLRDEVPVLGEAFAGRRTGSFFDTCR